MPKKKKSEEVKEAQTEQTSAEQTEEAEKAAQTEPETDEKDEKISSLEKELAAQKDKYLRLAAEYENYRKRTAGEKLSLYDDATAKAISELLPVADSMRMAIESAADADPEAAKGIELISNQLKKAFEKLKVEEYGAQGDSFDPNIHNAVSKIENPELGENTVAAVFQTGFKIGDKIIRHAMVQVANCD